MKNKNEEWFKVGKIALIGILSLLALSLIVSSIPVKVEGEAYCNSGFIGVEGFANLSHIENNSMQNFISLKNIDDLNCDFKFKVRAPRSLI